ncbi:MAG: DUF721 domain-containing protein [Vampirovibrionales bacterium]|nr:DUF721 domain-containing protein [Vampirovibrionales bacterium]
MASEFSDEKRAGRGARRAKSPRIQTRRAASELTSLANVLPQVGESLGLERKAAELAMLALWRELTPPPYRDRSRALKIIRQGEAQVLQVGVEDGATAGDLSFQLEAIRARLNAFSAQTGVTIDRIQLMTR